MKKRVFLTKTVIFLLIGLLLFFLLQKIVTPKREPIIFPTRSKYLQEQSADVAFLGSSYVYNGISPMEIYMRTGITVYDLTTNAQILPCSYFYLRDFFETQSPKVIVLDAQSLFYKAGNCEDGWRYVFDTTPLGKMKWDMVTAYRGETRKSFWDTLSLFIPIIDYHTRWKELTAVDFTGAPAGLSHSAGHLMAMGVGGISYTADWVNFAANEMEQFNQGWYVSSAWGYKSTGVITEPIFVEEISDWNKSWFLKIQKLCIEHNAELLLSKVPTMVPPQEYPGEVWTYKKRDMAKALAWKYGIPFVDLEYGEKIGLDFTKDTSDGGKHLNIRGAEKLSAFWAEYLKKSIGLGDGNLNSKQYNAMMRAYQKIKDVGMLQSETEFSAYLERLLKHCEEWDVVFCSLCSFEECAVDVSDKDLDRLRELGCTLIDLPEFRATHICYGAALSNGQAACERISNRRITEDIVLNNNNISFTVSNWHTEYFESVLVNGQEYTLGQPHLSFVVIDKQTGIVIDSVDFNPQAEVSRDVHSDWLRFREYEAEICKIVSVETGYDLGI